MIKKYDSYYEREIPYTMNLEELLELSINGDSDRAFFREENVVAYIRHRGDKFRVWMHAAGPKQITGVGHLLGMMGLALVTGDRDHKTLCRQVLTGDLAESDLYNPLIEKDSFPKEGHWYHAHKILFTPVWYPGVVERLYVADLVSGLNQEEIEIWESDEPEFLETFRFEDVLK